MNYNYKKNMFSMLVNFYCPCCGVIKRTTFAMNGEPYLQKILDDKTYEEITDYIIAVEDGLCDKCNSAIK